LDDTDLRKQGSSASSNNIFDIVNIGKYPVQKGKAEKTTNNTKRKIVKKVDVKLIKFEGENK
jgi:ABC-type hemin transport system ATPase subunit